MYNNITRYTEKQIEQILTEELGPTYTEYRKMWNGVSVHRFPSFPIHIDFEVNDLCNQSCVMCPRNAGLHPNINYKVNTKVKASLDPYKRVIDEGVQKGLQSVNFGAFAEPLIYRELFELIEYAHAKGIVDSRLVSNGLLLDKCMNEIFESKLRNLFISLDAFTSETYQKIRGPGFEKVKQNLLNFLAERERRRTRLPIIRVSFVDMEINKGEKEAFIAYWKDKVDMIDIQVYDNFNVDVTKPFDKSIKKKWDCRSPWARVSVLANGNILPCCSFFGINIPIGNIKEDTIEEAWNSPAMAKVRQGLLDDSVNNCSICQRAQ